MTSWRWFAQIKTCKTRVSEDIFKVPFSLNHYGTKSSINVSLVLIECETGNLNQKYITGTKYNSIALCKFILIKKLNIL